MEKPIRILQMIGSLNVGGSQTMILNIHKQLNTDEIQFDYVVDHSSQLFFAEELKKLGAKIFFMPSFNGFNYLKVKKAWSSFFKHHPEYKIIHSHVRSYASIFLKIAQKYKLCTIIHSHSTSNGKGVKALIKALLQKKIVRYSNFYFACSHEAGIWLYGKEIVNSPNFYILKNAIDSKKYIFNCKIRENMRNALKVYGNVYIHVGRFHPAKNHFFLLKLFADIVKTKPNSTLLLIGDGELNVEIKELAKKLNIVDHILFVGNVSNVYDYLQCADIFLFPSLWEGVGISVIEAQASGLRCICSENVPREAKITDDCVFVPLDNYNLWLEESLKTEYSRKNNLEKIIEHGYDISSTSRWITDFYTSIARGDRL